MSNIINKIRISGTDYTLSATTYTKTETDNKIDEKIAEAGGMTSGAVQSMIDSSISNTRQHQNANNRCCNLVPPPLA